MTSNNLSYNLSYNSNLMIKFYNMILKYYKNFKIIENNSKNSNYERFHSYIYKKLNNIYNTLLNVKDFYEKTGKIDLLEKIKDDINEKNIKSKIINYKYKLIILPQNPKTPKPQNPTSRIDI